MSRDTDFDPFVFKWPFLSRKQNTNCQTVRRWKPFSFAQVNPSTLLALKHSEIFHSMLALIFHPVRHLNVAWCVHINIPTLTHTQHILFSRRMEDPHHLAFVYLFSPWFFVVLWDDDSCCLRFCLCWLMQVVNARRRMNATSPGPKTSLFGSSGVGR